MTDKASMMSNKVLAAWWLWLAFMVFGNGYLMWDLFKHEGWCGL